MSTVHLRVKASCHWVIQTFSCGASSNIFRFFKLKHIEQKAAGTLHFARWLNWSLPAVKLKPSTLANHHSSNFSPPSSEKSQTFWIYFHLKLSMNLRRSLSEKPHFSSCRKSQFQSQSDLCFLNLPICFSLLHTNWTSASAATWLICSCPASDSESPPRWLQDLESHLCSSLASPTTISGWRPCISTHLDPPPY